MRRCGRSSGSQVVLFVELLSSSNLLFRVLGLREAEERDPTFPQTGGKSHMDYTSLGGPVSAVPHLYPSSRFPISCCLETLQNCNFEKNIT
jgi:hypothetical protein